MRIYLKLTRNKDYIPFNYQHLLTGTIHRWIGKDNTEHGEISLYSFSWLQQAKANHNGIYLTSNSYFFISAYKEGLIKAILQGILSDPSVCCGIEVYEAQIMGNPKFSTEERFLLGSPAFIKRNVENVQKHFLFNDDLSSQYMTDTVGKKLSLANLSSEGFSIEFDKSYMNPQTKLIDYKGIKNKVSICPVIIKGSPQQIAFAWNVGVGNSTGVGFGSLK